MRAAVYQGTAAVLDTGANIAQIDAAAARAAAAGADVLLTPELFVTGYAPALVRERLDPAQLPGLRRRLAEIAVGHGIGLVYSLPAVNADGSWSITATLVDASGAELINYAKVNLFGPAERAAFSPAAEPPTVVDFQGIATSIIVCYDVEFPEMVRAAAARGAQLLLVPTALGEGYEVVPETVLPARALESQLFIAYANHSGTEDGAVFAGSSVVAGPDGTLRAEAGTRAELITADIEADDVAQARGDVPYLEQLRTPLYRAWEQQLGG